MVARAVVFSIFSLLVSQAQAQSTFIDRSAQNKAWYGSSPVATGLVAGAAQLLQPDGSQVTIQPAPAVAAGATNRFTPAPTAQIQVPVAGGMSLGIPIPNSAVIQPIAKPQAPAAAAPAAQAASSQEEKKEAKLIKRSAVADWPQLTPR